ncbi:MAG: LruC domain-containing protein [Candidatus Stygibacter australis]|nr:LruC domain-containing protein [Candidatus Stygibacter australis]MDP8321676.1 LruC domain-containing protein [Candidatus Stygibacter australis]
MKKITLILLVLVVSLSLFAGLKVRPIMECVENNGDGTYTAKFGYLNENPNVLTINIGVHNTFVGAPSEDMGQPTIFQSGRYTDVFTADFVEGDNFVWTLGGPNGHGSVNSNSGSTACPRGDDSDLDGVTDEYDEYPDDPFRAYNNWYPAEGANEWGTLAYEDYWPLQGDYDFNDLIVDYRFNLVTDGSNLVVDVDGYFRMRAIGASFSNGFGIEFPFHADSLEVLEVLPAELTPVQEVSGTNLVLLFFDSSMDYMSPVGDELFVNTELTESFVSYFEFSMAMTLNPTQNINNLVWYAPFNPFIFIDGERGKEVHLAGFPPTESADRSYFGTGDDDSNLAQERYYKTASNLPWGLNLPTPWIYPIERASITEAYLFMADWAESSGTIHTDWYESTAGNIDSTKLYYQR